MPRTSQNGAPPANIDSLDQINIDDMFADDGDLLFDGLDLELQPIGDMADNLGVETQVDEITTTNETAVAPAAEEAPAVEALEAPKRRKPRRKAKNPTATEEGDDTSKKKRKGGKINAPQKKTKLTKSESDPPPPKIKGKSKNSVAVPPPLRPTGVPVALGGNVAAAGQFGGRQKRPHTIASLRTSSDKPKSKQKVVPKPVEVTLDKLKSKKQLMGSSTMSETTHETTKQTIQPITPFPQTTFCGLKPSSTLFFPFMSQPAETSIKKGKYLVLERISASFARDVNPSSNLSKGVSGVSPVSEREPIFKLMQDTGQSNDRNNDISTDRMNAVANAIGSSRRTVAGLEKASVIRDLLSICSLLRRQHDFLTQNLSNMERWCKGNLSEADYVATYCATTPVARGKKETTGLSADSVLLKLMNPLARVRIKCSALKEAKILWALLPPALGGVVLPITSSVANIDGPKEKKVTTKKRKLSPQDATSVPTGPTNVIPDIDAPILTYPNAKPEQRRMLITETVTKTAKELEVKYSQGTEEYQHMLDRRDAELQKVVDEDEVAVIHTAAMWQYIEKAGYFAEFSEEFVRETLRSKWSPEVVLRHNTKNKDVQSLFVERMHKNQEHYLNSRDTSVFDRLQSLLVEENVSGDETCDLDALNDDLEEDGVQMHQVSPTEHNPFVSLSDLSLDERTWMWLENAGLLESAETTKHVSATVLDKREDSSELEDTMAMMSEELIRLNRRNNERAAFLESAGRAYRLKMSQSKRQREEDGNLISRCQQLLKRTKDIKTKSAKPKNTKDEYALPW